MLTPHSALELNYSFTQNNEKYCIGGGCTPGFPNLAGVTNFYSYRIHSREQEITGAYVFSWTFKRYNPFVEAGVGTIIFTPVLDNGTTELGTKTTKGIAGLAGGGLAYELSPSFDIRAEYRAFVVKTPAFGEPNIVTNRYEILSMPTIGVAITSRGDVEIAAGYARLTTGTDPRRKECVINGVLQNSTHTR